ncbi:MAG: ABC transporter ATP-binding protein [Bacteroidaceae bacterium]|nr:ABC transporter ATP-binding protein [Bacteroidaceae bacterium]
MKQPTIKIESLSTGYRGKNNVTIVAHNINATIHGGELTCLLGPNGAGKSTLLRTLSAFLPPVEGSITIMGRNLRDYSDKELAKAIGVVLTEKTDLRNMSVEDLIGLGRSPYTGFWGNLHDEDRQKVAEAIEMVGIEPLKDRMIQTLSDGERQKVMIAKALAQETPVIFLDEPTAFLDFPSKVEIMQLLRNLTRTMGKTIFLSTHDLELAIQIADTIWLMDRNKGVSIGSPEDLAIQGTLGEYFVRKGIKFDMERGMFRIENEYNRCVRLTGEEPIRSLIEKALNRNGISVIDSASDIAIDVSSDRIKLEQKDKETVEFTSVSEMLNSLFQ